MLTTNKINILLAMNLTKEVNSMGFAIDKSVPIPESAKFKRQRGRTKYGFENMEVGDSIFFDGESSTIGCRPYLSAAAYGAKYNKKFIAKTVLGGVRIWRVA